MTIAGHQTNSEREPLDFYPTDPAWTRILLRHCAFNGPLLEPCAGDGAMVDPLRAAGYTVLASDLHPRRRDIQQRDALDIPSAENIVTNPPYRALAELVPHWLATTTSKVALLVRLNYLEGSRRMYLVQQLSLVVVVAGRMRVHGKTSQFPHAWCIWDRQHEGNTRLVVDVPR